MRADPTSRRLRRATCLGIVAVFTVGLSAAQEVDFYSPFPSFQSAEAIVAIVGSEAEAAFMVSESLKRFAAKRSASRSPASRTLEPVAAAQFREDWVRLSGVPIVRLSHDQALRLWNSRQRLLGILRIERGENSLTIYIGTVQRCSGGAIAYRFTRAKETWPVSEHVAPAFVTHSC